MVREILFRRPLTLCVLSERRVYQPYGMSGKSAVCRTTLSDGVGVFICVPGGQPGAKGRNQLIRKNKDVIDLGGKKAIEALPGVRVL